MKKILFILLIFTGSGIFCGLRSQVWIPYALGMGGLTDSVSVSYITGQPYVSPENYSTGFGNFLWIPEDTLFSYRLGEIPDKVVHHNSVCRFRYYWDGHPGANYFYNVLDRVDTALILEPEDTAAIFNYTPVQTDLFSFNVEFSAIDGNDTVRQTVLFTPVPLIKAEQEFIGYQHEQEFFDTILVQKTWEPGDPMNFSNNDSVLIVNLIGKTIVFKEGNIPFSYQNLSNLKELNIYATNLIIQDTVHIPQTRIHIYAENLIFEDNGGIISSFNTMPRTPTTTGLKGLDGREFHCYIKNIIAPGKHLRFFMKGGQGSPSLFVSPENFSAPGGGGNGGDFYSNLNLRPYINLDGGSYGKPTDWKKMPLGPQGDPGTYHFEENWYSWLHPNAVRLNLQYTRESYIYGHDELVRSTCQKYINFIQSYKKTDGWNNDTIGRLDLEQIYYAFSSILEQLNENLDYFGNPRGWAPLLSFEANLENYKNEIEFSIRVLYLNYWLSTKAASLEDKQEAAQLLKVQCIAEIMRLRDLYSATYVEYGPNLLRFKNYVNKLDSVTTFYNMKIEALLTTARKNVENSWESRLRQIGYIAGQVCKFIPGPASQILGSTLQTAASLDYDDPLSMDNWSKIHETLTLAMDEFGTAAENASGLIGGMNPASMAEAAGKQAMHNAEVVLNNLSPESLQKIGPAIKELTIPDGRVKAEFERLKRNTPILEVWTDSMEVYSMKKGESAQALSFNQQQLSAIPREITKLLLGVDAMDNILIRTEDIADPRAMSYLNEMEKTAWERMVRYHYYLAMAYQYRFLKPYGQALNMQPLFESFATLAEYDADLTPDQYASLLVVFEDQIKLISDEIYTSFNDGTYSEFNEPVNYTLAKNQLNELNTTGELKINIWNSGKIPREFTDCRITNMSIVEEKLSIHADTILADASLTMLMAHSGNSALIHPETGEHFMFSQYNDDAAEYYNTSSMSPLGWAEKYFFYNKEIVSIERSLASQSLIKNILNVADDNDLMIFTRPAGWAEIKLVNTLYTGEHANMNYTIDSLTLRINIDYRATTKFSNILVNTSDGLLPLITCSKPDLNGRDYGWGNFTRSFNKNDGIVTFTAPEDYGIYTFDKWLITTNTGTNSVSYPSIGVNTLSHTWISAIYILNVPDLSIPDTLYANWDQGILDIDIKNLNVCDHLPMDWFSTSDANWFSIKEGTDKGLEDGKITLQLTTNSGNQRTGKVTVYAFDASKPEQEVTIIQKSKLTGIGEQKLTETGILIYPNPADKEIWIQLLTPPDNDRYIISFITLDGQILFSDELLHFSSEPYKLSLEQLPPGMYILRVDKGGSSWYRKFSRM